MRSELLEFGALLGLGIVLVALFHAIVRPQAKAVLIVPLVIGAGKAEMIERVATGDDPVHDIPIKGIDPIGGRLCWYLDDAACGRG